VYRRQKFADRLYLALSEATGRLEIIQTEVGELESGATQARSELTHAQHLMREGEEAAAQVHDYAAVLQRELAAVQAELQRARKRGINNNATQLMAAKAEEMAAEMEEMHSMVAAFQVQQEQEQATFAQREEFTQRLEAQLAEGRQRLRVTEVEVGELQRDASEAERDVDEVRGLLKEWQEAVSLVEEDTHKLQMELRDSRRQLQEAGFQGFGDGRRDANGAARQEGREEEDPSAAQAARQEAQAARQEAQAKREHSDRLAAVVQELEAAVPVALQAAAERERRLQEAQAAVAFLEEQLIEAERHSQDGGEGEGGEALQRRGASSPAAKDAQAAVAGAEDHLRAALQKAKEESESWSSEVTAVRSQLQNVISFAQEQRGQQRGELSKVGAAYSEKLEEVTAEIQRQGIDPQAAWDLAGKIERAKEEVKGLERMILQVEDAARDTLPANGQAKVAELRAARQELEAQLASPDAVSSPEVATPLQEARDGVEEQLMLLLHGAMTGQQLQRDSNLRQMLWDAKASLEELQKGDPLGLRVKQYMLQWRLEEVEGLEAKLTALEPQLEAQGDPPHGEVGDVHGSVAMSVMEDLSQLRAFQDEMLEQQLCLAMMLDRYKADIGDAKRRAHQVSQKARQLRAEIGQLDRELQRLKLRVPSVAAVLKKTIADHAVAAAIAKEVERKGRGGSYSPPSSSSSSLSWPPPSTAPGRQQLESHPVISSNGAAAPLQEEKPQEATAVEVEVEVEVDTQEGEEEERTQPASDDAQSSAVPAEVVEVEPSSAPEEPPSLPSGGGLSDQQQQQEAEAPSAPEEPPAPPSGARFLDQQQEEEEEEEEEHAGRNSPGVPFSSGSFLDQQHDNEKEEAAPEDAEETESLPSADGLFDQQQEQVEEEEEEEEAEAPPAPEEAAAPPSGGGGGFFEQQHAAASAPLLAPPQETSTSGAFEQRPQPAASAEPQTLAAPGLSPEPAEQPAGAGSSEPGSPPPAAPSSLVVATCAGYNIPHREKLLSTGGEDAFFATPPNLALGKPWLGAMGVADGVGAWEDRGVDAGLYSRTIMRHCADRAGPNGPPGQSLKEALHYAQKNTNVLGSCTACVLRMEEGGKLASINLGDCGFRILRAGKVVAESKIQQWELNMPYQMADLERFPDAETPEHADLYEHAVQVGDVVVAGSDGLFDNMWEEEMCAIVSSFHASFPEGWPYSGDNALELARRLAKQAYTNSGNKSYRSPWAVHEAEAEASSEVQLGGKPDDITVTVAFVQQQQP